jgi:Ca2+-binding RTX toxin-like protein
MAYLVGTSGNDTLAGTVDNDTLAGLGGADTLSGGAGDDELAGGAGDDLIDGGDGFDLATYTDVGAGVTVSLAIVGAQSTGGAGTDTLRNIEGLVGSGYADQLTGDDAANKLFGYYGNDTLRGGGGDDTLDGGQGDDVLDGGAGFDTVDYSGAEYFNITVDLGTGIARPNFGQDTLISIERVLGSGGSDTLKAGSIGVTLVGGGGDDMLYSGAGDDVLDGGAGNDTFYLSGGADKVTGGAGTDTMNIVAGASAMNIDLSAYWSSGQYNTNGLSITGVEILGAMTGGSQNDTFVVGDGYTGYVILDGGAGDDTLTGGGGSDRINGGAGDDILNGGAGSDTITGGAGRDALSGGAGDDFLTMDAIDRSVDGGAGMDILSFDWAYTYAPQALNIDFTGLWTGGFGLVNGAEVRGVEKIDIFNGSALADRVVFGAGAVSASFGISIDLGDGNDYAFGSAGSDYLEGGAGDDTLYGGDGNDTLRGGDGGADQLFGGNGDDILFVSGADTVDGGAGFDALRFISSATPASVLNLDLRGLWTGGTGTINGATIVNVEDTYDIVGTNNADTIIVGDGLASKVSYQWLDIAGRENYIGLILRGYGGDDTIVGSGGNDKIYGDSGADKISGGAGDDIIIIDGKDTIDGGAGIDTLGLNDEYHRSADAFDLDLRANWDGVAGSSITSIERFFGGYASDFNDRIIVGDKYTFNGVELNGGGGDDVIVGSGANDKLYGDTGADQLSGGAGDDVLGGNMGNDVLDGGAGNDTAFFGGNAADYSWTVNADGSLTVRDLRDPVAQAYAYSGVDTLRNIEILQFWDRTITLANQNGLTVTGTAGADTLTGGPGNDVLSGLGGDDVLIGGAGDDLLDGGDGFDVVSFENASGPVSVIQYMDGRAQNTGAGFDTLISIEGIIGSAYADTLYGSNGADTLKGGAGDDTLDGGVGNDILDGGDGFDTILVSGNAIDYAWNQNTDGSWTIKQTNGTLYGVDTLRNVEQLRFNDKTVSLASAGVISGGAANDYLVSTAGNDIVRGGDGHDIIVSGAGDDIYDGGADTDYVIFSDGIVRGVTVDLALSGPQDTGEGRDTFIGVESIIATRFNDTLRGDDGYNDLQGMKGDDVIDGRGGDDNLSGYSGNDIIHGGTGNDIVSGGTGNDQLFGDAGNDYIPLYSESMDDPAGDDIIDGGDGIDTLEAIFVREGVVIDLGRTDRQAIATGSWITVKNVENINGSWGDDRLTGDAGDNYIQGANGNDLIDGGKGVDTVVMRGSSTDFTVTWTVDGWKIADKRPFATPESNQLYDGVDLVRNVEYISFSDKRVSLGDGMPFVLGNILRSTSGASANLAADLSVRLANGALDGAGALAQVINAAGATTSVATLAYEFFTGKIPGQAGVDYLVSPTGPNANNLNSAYYQSFNLENRYINFAVNLGKLGEGKDAFAAKYGAMTLFDATREVYRTIFGAAPTDAKIHVLIDSRADYFAIYGGDGVGGIGTKAAMVGWLLAEAQKADLGVMAKANDAWLTDLADGSAPFGVNILDPANGYYKADFIFGG